MKNPWQYAELLDLDEADVNYHTVQITECSKKRYWYANLVGSVFEVFELLDEDDEPKDKVFRVLNQDSQYEGKFIDKKDCKVIG